MLSENIDRNLFEISVVDSNGAHKTVQLLSKDNVCYVDIGDISTKDITNKYKLLISYEGKQAQIEYSVMSYLYEASQKKAKDEKIMNLVKLIYWYGK